MSVWSTRKSFILIIHKNKSCEHDQSILRIVLLTSKYKSQESTSSEQVRVDGLTVHYEYGMADSQQFPSIPDRDICPLCVAYSQVAQRASAGQFDGAAFPLLMPHVPGTHEKLISCLR